MGIFQFPIPPFQLVMHIMHHFLSFVSSINHLAALYLALQCVYKRWLLLVMLVMLRLENRITKITNLLFIIFKCAIFLWWFLRLYNYSSDICLEPYAFPFAIQCCTDSDNYYLFSVDMLYRKQLKLISDCSVYQTMGGLMEGSIVNHD